MELTLEPPSAWRPRRPGHLEMMKLDRFQNDDGGDSNQSGSVPRRPYRADPLRGTSSGPMGPISLLPLLARPDDQMARWVTELTISFRHGRIAPHLPAGPTSVRRDRHGGGQARVYPSAERIDHRGQSVPGGRNPRGGVSDGFATALSGEALVG